MANCKYCNTRISIYKKHECKFKNLINELPEIFYLEHKKQPEILYLEHESLKERKIPILHNIFQKKILLKESLKIQQQLIDKIRTITRKNNYKEQFNEEMDYYIRLENTEITMSLKKAYKTGHCSCIICQQEMTPTELKIRHKHREIYARKTKI